MGRLQVAKLGFFLLRLLVSLSSLAALAGTLVVILFLSTLKFVKDGASAFAAVVTIFASGFQRSPGATEPGFDLPLPLAGLAILFLAMFASVFMPQQKIFLHGVAAMALAGAIWQIWRMATIPGTSVLYLPVIGIWIVYYVLSLRRA